MFGKGKNPDETFRTARIKRRLSIVATAAVLAGVLVLLIIDQPWRSTRDPESPDRSSSAARFTSEDTGLSVSGTTVLATVEQRLAFDPDVYDLEIESIQAVAGTAIASGEPLLTLTNSSIEQARVSLQQEATSALNDYNQAVITYQETMAEIQASLDKNRELGSIAEQDYTIALFDLQKAVDAAEDAMDEAHDIIANHPTRIAAAQQELTYRDHDLDDAEEDAEDSQSDLAAASRIKEQAVRDVSGYQAILDFLDEQEDELDSLQFADVRTIAENRLAEAQVALDSVSQSVATLNEEASKDQSKVANLQSAVSQYESLVDSLASELESANRNLAEIELTYHKANLNLISQRIELELSYQTSLVDYRSADSQYTQSLQDAKSVYEKAEWVLSQTHAVLEDFESELGDGIIYSLYSGPVSSLGYDAGDTLSTAIPVATMLDAAQVTVSVTVDQADIHRLTVGDPVTVEIRSSDQSVFDATITQINPTSSSYSMSNVYYTVVVTLAEPSSSLTSDLEATVIFNGEDPGL